MEILALLFFYFNGIEPVFCIRTNILFNTLHVLNAWWLLWPGGVRSSLWANPHMALNRKRSEVESQYRKAFGAEAVWLASTECHATSFCRVYFALLVPLLHPPLLSNPLLFSFAQFVSNISTLKCGIHFSLMTSAAHSIFSFIPHRLPPFKYSKYQTVLKHISGLRIRKLIFICSFHLKTWSQVFC